MLPDVVVIEAPCVDREGFTQSLQRHSLSANADGRIEVRIGDGEGHVRVTRPRGSWERTIEGQSCEEIVDALALVVAMSFDQEEAEAPPPRTIAPPSPLEPDRAEPPAKAASWRGAIGGTAAPLLLGTAAASLTYGAFGELELDRAGFAPSVRIGVTHAQSSATVGFDAVGLSWTTVHLDVCPVRRDFTSALTFRACAAGDGGVLAAAPRGLSGAHDENRAWVSASAIGRFRFVPASLLFVDGDLGVTIPITRDELAADPALTLYRAPVVAPLLAISAGVRFP